jgi:biotin carboxyl carrier protein
MNLKATSNNSKKKGYKMANIIKVDGTMKPGKVGKIEINVGDTVVRGAKLLSIESAKGNSIVKTRFAGTVSKISIEEGATVKLGDVLVEIE